MDRPHTEEYAEYYQQYIDSVPGSDVLQALSDSLVETTETLQGLDDARGSFRYAEGKWSAKELIGHVIDIERVFGVRTLAIARGEKQALFGVDQHVYVNGADFDRRSWASLVAEYRGLRASHLALFESLGEEEQLRRGVASDCTFTARSLPWIMAGHELWHMRVLRERYLQG